VAASNFPNWLAGNRITAGQLNAMLPLAVTKPADEPVTSSTVMQNDNDLVLAVAANAAYTFSCYLNYEGGTINASDIKWQWVLPAGAHMTYWSASESPGGTLVAQLTNIESTVGAAATNGAGNLRAVYMYGGVQTSSTAGNLQLQWAQNSSSATATIVHAKSTLTLDRTA
jgi:hypothetical protein